MCSFTLPDIYWRHWSKASLLFISWPTVPTLVYILFRFWNDKLFAAGEVGRGEYSSEIIQ